MKSVCPCCHQEFSPPPPSVSQEATEDMSGLFDCDHCQSILKWENQSLKVVYESTEGEGNEGEVSDADAIITQKKQEPEDIIDGEYPVDDGELEKEPEENNATVADDDLAGEENPITEETQQNSVVIKEEQSEEAPVEGSSEFLDAFSEQDDSQMEEDLSAAVAEQESEINQDFSDVEKYGNAQATSEKGFLRYDLRISGLDSSEIEQQIMFILEDPRFNWDAKEILKSQKEGVLVIKNLNPIKAMCLVSDLSFLSVLELSWKQYMALDVSEA